MKTIRFTFPVLMISLLLLSFDPEQQGVVPEEVYSALKAGNSKVLAKYFNDNIELVILEKEGVYSKTQAELVLREFFSKNAPTSFQKLFEGKSEKGGSKFVICKLTTSSGQYRITFFVRKSNDGEFNIHQLRIENDNN
jgi:hypothetical protein